MHKTVIKAFLIEDNSGDVRLIKKMLSEATGVRFATECCTRLQSCLERLTKGGIDVILLDLGLPDSQGFETFNKVHEWAPALPIIVLTGLNDEELAAKAVRMGAQDYLLKGQLDSSLLVHAIRYAIERKRAEEALREKTNELAGMVAKLEASNRELDQFAYLVSRDLKAPLGAIVNLAQWIEDYIGGMLSGETKKYMELLRNRVLRMDAMIDALLQYSRVGRIQTQVEAVDVNALLTEVIDVVAPPPGFKIEVGANMPVIVMERGRLEQVFINLIDNAVKHHNRSNGRIKVSVSDTGRFHIFSVADDGPGIAPEFHAKVFEIFQTLQSRDVIENTGIGLALVKKIVSDQGGELTLKSREGQGAVFRFTWPKRRIGNTGGPGRGENQKCLQAGDENGKKSY